MENKQSITNKNIFFNYFSNETAKDSKQQSKLGDLEEREERTKQKDISFMNNHTRNRPHNSGEKYFVNKTIKNGSRYYSTDYTNKSLITSVDKTKLNLNLNVNLNVTETHSNKDQKKFDEFLKSNFSKLDESKLSRIIAQSPISNQYVNHGNINSKLVENIRSSKNISNMKVVYSKWRSRQSKSPIDTKNANLNLTSNSQSKYNSLNTSFFKNKLANKNIVKEYSIHNQTKEDNKLISESSRQKLQKFKELSQELSLKNKDLINKEMQTFLYSLMIGPVGDEFQITKNNCSIFPISQNSVKQSIQISQQNDNSNCHEKENKNLKDKIEQLDIKFETMLKENLELKQLIKNKTEHFNKLNNEMNNFKKELKSIKNTKNLNLNLKVKSVKGSPIKSNEKINQTIHKNTHLTNVNSIEQNPKEIVKNNNISKTNHNMSCYNGLRLKSPPTVSKNNKQNKNHKSLQKSGKIRENSFDFSRLDTLDLMSRTSVEDPVSIFYFPKKVSNKNNNSEIYNKIPKLDISSAMNELEEQDILAQIKGEAEIEIQNNQSQADFEICSIDQLNEGFMEKDSFLNDNSKILKSNLNLNFVSSNDHIPRLDDINDFNKYEGTLTQGKFLNPNEDSAKPKSNQKYSKLKNEDQSSSKQKHNIFINGTFDSDEWK